MEKQPITLKALRQVVRKMSRSGLQEIAWQRHNGTIRIRCTPRIEEREQAPATLIPEPVALLPVCSHFPGRLLLSHPSHGKPFVQPGQSIDAGALLALVQVGALYFPVSSPVAATVATISLPCGSLLEYGSEIVRLQPDETSDVRL